MANVDKAFGLRALGNLSATGGQKQYGYEIEDNQSGAIYQGDLVTILTATSLSSLLLPTRLQLASSTAFFTPTPPRASPRGKTTTPVR
jgi:hypothetical protein